VVASIIVFDGANVAVEPISAPGVPPETAQQATETVGADAPVLPQSRPPAAAQKLSVLAG
jgi:hypothetical protein